MFLTFDTVYFTVSFLVRNSKSTEQNTATYNSDYNNNTDYNLSDTSGVGTPTVEIEPINPTKSETRLEGLWMLSSHELYEKLLIFMRSREKHFPIVISDSYSMSEYGIVNINNQEIPLLNTNVVYSEITKFGEQYKNGLSVNINCLNKKNCIYNLKLRTYETRIVQTFDTKEDRSYFSWVLECMARKIKEEKQ